MLIQTFIDNQKMIIQKITLTKQKTIPCQQRPDKETFYRIPSHQKNPQSQTLFSRDTKNRDENNTFDCDKFETLIKLHCNLGWERNR
jgi:hypothetical protein